MIYGFVDIGGIMMKIQIDTERLNSFLQSKKNLIKKTRFPIDAIVASATFIFSLLTIEKYRISFISKSDLDKIFVALLIAYILYNGIIYYKSLKNKYTINNLYNDIIRLSKDTSEFSLLIIKDSSQEHINKILLAYDKRWHYYQLPYIKSDFNDTDNINNCKNKASSYLRIPTNIIEISYLGDNYVEKYSVSNKRSKNYHHKFYKIDIILKNDKTIKKSTKKLKRKAFKVDGKKYKWFTLDEMLNNQKMMEYNRDVIDKIKEYHII